MTLTEVNSMMAEIMQRCNLTDYTYYQFADDSAPELPYMIFYYPSSANDGADNVVWQKINHLNIELYTDNKEFGIENELEAVLTEHGFFYDKAEQFIESEKMFEVLYEMEVVING
jgi:hypothetical protein